MNAANEDYRRKPIDIGHSGTYEDQFLPNKNGLILPTYFHKTYYPLFVLKQSTSKNIYLRRISR
jgi:hypothetical protein